jgi:hypothetical protein
LVLQVQQRREPIGDFETVNTGELSSPVYVNIPIPVRGPVQQELEPPAVLRQQVQQLVDPDEREYPFRTRFEISI